MSVEKEMPRAPDAANLSQADVSADLTEAGLLVDRVEVLARLYAQHLDWSVVKQEWHTHRLSGRGSRHSAQKIFRVIRDRLQAPGGALPSVPQLSRVLADCHGARSKAQIVHLYLAEADGLVRYVIHQLTRERRRQPWDLSPERLLRILEAFRYADGASLQYAESTLRRWVQGLRSVFREIGVLSGAQDREGTTPMLEDLPLLVSAGYSWKRQKEQWQQRPLGWTYLLQSMHHREVLLKRLASSSRWTMRQLRDETLLVPTSSDSVFDFTK